MRRQALLRGTSACRSGCVNLFGHLRLEIRNHAVGDVENGKLHESALQIVLTLPLERLRLLLQCARVQPLALECDIDAVNRRVEPQGVDVRVAVPGPGCAERQAELHLLDSIELEGLLEHAHVERVEENLASALASQCVCHPDPVQVEDGHATARLV